MCKNVKKIPQTALTSKKMTIVLSWSRTSTVEQYRNPAAAVLHVTLWHCGKYP